MPGFTDAYQDKTINHFLRNSAQTPDAALWLELLTVPPNETGSGGTEVTGGGYARQGIAFATPAAGEAVSVAGQDFGVASAAWGTVTHIALRTAASAGTRVTWGLLTTPLLVASGTPVSFAAGAVRFRAPTKFTTSYRNRIINHFLRNSVQTPDPALWFALYTTQPGPDGTGGVEVAASWYARQPITMGVPSAGVSSNTGLVKFVDNATAVGGTIVAGCFTNAASAGSLVFVDALTVPIVAALGSTVDFPAGQISVTVE